MIEKQELWCHNCSNYVQFDLDLSIDGNYVLNCPKCGHEHCRRVVSGKITDERWDSRNTNIQTIPIYNTTYSSTSITMTCASTGGIYLTNAWCNTTNCC